MKKLILTSAIALSTLFASAQNFMVVSTYDGDQEETTDNLTVGVGYSYNVWKGLNVEPNYSIGLKEDENGEREGTFNLGLSYRF